MSAVLMKQTFTDETNNANWSSNWLYKAMVLFSAFFLSLILVGCGGGGGGSNSNESDNSTNSHVKSIAVGWFHSFAILNNGKVYAAGNNFDGQLGLGDTNNRTVFVEVSSLNGKKITAIAAVEKHSLALSDDGKVYAAGYDQIGQVGMGGIYNSTVFTEVSSLSSKNITAIAMGDAHSLALSHEGKVYVAGSNSNGQLGLGDNNDRDIFTEASFLSDKNIIAIAAGEKHSFALSHEGRVYAVGNNEYGQLGMSDITYSNIFREVPPLNGKNITAIATNILHSIALSDDGKVYAAGMNIGGQLGFDSLEGNIFFTEIPFLSDKNITAIIAGSLHSFALSHEGKVYASGANRDGWLGLGDTDNRYVFTENPFLNDKNITAVVAGVFHSLALSHEGRVYAAGNNEIGQLGLGDNDNRNVFTEVTIP